ADIQGLPLNARTRTKGGASTSGSLDLQEPEDGSTHMLLPRRAERHATLLASVPSFGGTTIAEFIASSERFNDAANQQKLAGYGLVNLGYEQVLQRQWKWFARMNNA